jgi:hypothetical protein
MLSKYDDFPIHQTSEPILHPATGDRNFYGRYWFNGFSKDGALFFALALGVYPNRHVMDASLSIVVNGVQHSFHASRRAPDERSETTVGPLRVEVIEPMKVLRVTLSANETGLECDLLFRARTCAIEEPPSLQKIGTRTIMHTCRFTQFGSWQGSIATDGQRFEVGPDEFLGTRDRSWGVRPVGEPEGGAPSQRPPQLFWAWAPLHFDEFCTHFGVFEYADGTPWHSNGARIPAYASSDALPGIEDPALEVMQGVSHQIRWEKGTRRAASATIRLQPRSGDELVIELQPLLRFQMLGIGYLHPEWGHGVYKGELEIGGESWKLDDLDPLAFQNNHVQLVVRARLGELEGFGVLEQILFGPYAPGGFTETLDGAR